MFKQDNQFNLFQKFSFIFFDIICISETEEIEAIASHLKPKVIILYKSSRFLILLVEYFSITNGK